MPDLSIPPALLERLQAKYRERLVETAAILTPLVRHVLSRMAVDSDYQELRAQAHKLAGSGGSYGFDHLSECGRRLDQYLRTHREASDDMDVLALDLMEAVDAALGVKSASQKVE